MGATRSRTLDPNLLALACEFAQSAERTLLGIVGSPGSGKSTFAAELVAAVGPGAALVEMDGFHLANSILDSRGLRDRKGAPNTFDVIGFTDLLGALRASPTQPRFAPTFDRGVDASLGSAREIPSSARLIVVEGNYLLHDADGWDTVAPLLDTAWFLDPDPDTRRDRLIARHRVHGMSAEEARAWAEGTDAANARLIELGRDRADLVVAAPFV